MRAKGLTVDIEKGRGDTRTVEEVWLSTPFEIIGACRDPHGSKWGKLLRWYDADKRLHTKHVSDASLQGDPGSLCAALANEGLGINRNQQRQFITYLSGCSIKSRVTVVPRTGWHEIGGHQVFVLPTQTIGPVGSERVALESGPAGPYEALGTLDDWQAGIGMLSSGHALPVLAISIALAGQEGGGINLFTKSSSGKTTVLQMAASVWGSGAISGGFVRAWRATANGLEAAASLSTDTVLVLDEIGVLDARDAAAAIYSLANGEGKARMARDTSARESKSWRIMSLSSGEFPMETKLGEDKRKARAGQMVRMLDIPDSPQSPLMAQRGQNSSAGSFPKA
jgi:putative DNA primase/helicase